MKPGRPSSYNPELGAAICERLAAGESLRSVLRDPDMPSMSMVFRWLADDRYEKFRDQYAHAKEVGIEHMAQEILEISDDTSQDTLETEHGSKANNEWIQRSKLRVDTRKWLLSKLAPKKYGERTSMELTGANGGPVEISDTERAAKIAAIMASAEARKAFDGSDLV
ncbi:hypothetical protein UFOVP151_11 [uncultured Caudovirales phage]|uniref:Terminase small subunit n=1 Tax=uncultured Caudovirales phage TaxID=2100421 RepID=A0A6J7W990_9CAUD|nr:hypothetical protein UFOVP151_11 [uncultured Caudovirales phage]